MKSKKIIISSLFLAIGMILHQISPPILMGMKPDFLLAMMFIAILVSKDYKTTLVIGITAGVLTALTTNFPGGQIPNVIDKIITSQCVYFIYKIMGDKINNRIKILVISSIGTIISGCVFLSTALLMAGLPAPFGVLVVTVVLPATIINAIASFVLYGVVNTALKYSVNKV
ncbi:tryptophan transporter [Haloimpatiens sp. FM7330]|uniref:tryptophan transporter n=1 Tax=Haloimpatiens sp. FM7330 TaxID=3298610 RepID=UPI00363A8654